MNTNSAGAGAVSFLLDILPALILVILIIAFIYHYHKYRTEKRNLEKRIDRYTHR